MQPRSSGGSQAIASKGGVTGTKVQCANFVPGFARVLTAARTPTIVRDRMAQSTDTAWPDLPYEAWRDTCSTLHLWTQVVGKIRLARTPWLNHSWHVPLYVTARGLTTSSIPHETQTFEIAFDFADHALYIDTSGGARRTIELRPRTVADFHRAVLTALEELSVPVRINERPCEIAGAIPSRMPKTTCLIMPRHHT